MSRRFATPLFALVLVVACGGADRHAEPPPTSSGGAGPGVTSVPPAEPDAFEVPSTSSNPARRASYAKLAEARSGLLSNTLLGDGIDGSGFVAPGFGGSSGFGGTPGRSGGMPGVGGGSPVR